MTEVIRAALQFIQPRTLDAHKYSTFCLWGLDGLTAIDPAVSLDEPPANAKDPQLYHLTVGQRDVGTFPPPSASDLSSCIKFTLSVIDAAWQNSKTLRAAGQEAVLQSFFDELFNHLDPYSRYVGPAPAANDRWARSGDEGNLGMTLKKSGGTFIIVAINANGPAWSSGLDAGMHLLAINGQMLRGKSLEDVSSMLKGPSGTPVTLMLRKPGQPGFTQELRLQKVPPQTVYMQTTHQIAEFSITAFSSDTAEELSQYLDQALTEDKVKAIILDLRGDRGGVLQQAVTAVALLLDSGVAVTTEGRNTHANHIWTVQGGDMTKNLPIAILVDGRTASAAEILAAALADHRRAVVIGSATLGKGLVQAVGQMPNQGEIFVTWSRVLAPLGWPLQGLGVMPQICTSRGGAYVQEQMDALKTGHLLDESLIRVTRSFRFPIPLQRILEIRRQCPAALGTDVDMKVAETIVTHPQLYRAALNSIPDLEASPNMTPQM